MDLDPQIPKAVWGFNGTERPGAVYLACMLASMLRIPVAMHNVPESQVFQPHCWGLFGASDDPTGADYRACKNFGPLYATNR